MVVDRRFDFVYGILDAKHEGSIDGSLEGDVEGIIDEKSDGKSDIGHGHVHVQKYI